MRPLRLSKLPRGVRAIRVPGVKEATRRARGVWVGPVRPLDCVITLMFSGQQPSGKNHMGIRPQVVRSTQGTLVTKLQRFPGKAFEAWREDVERQFAPQRIPWAMYFPIREPVTAFVRYVASDRLGRDVPGLEDALWHALERMRVVANDRLFQDVVFLQLPVNRAGAQVSIEIVPVAWRWEIRRFWETPSTVCQTGGFVLPDRQAGHERSLDAPDDHDNRIIGRDARGGVVRLGDVGGESESGLSHSS